MSALLSAMALGCLMSAVAGRPGFAATPTTWVPRGAAPEAAGSSLLEPKPDLALRLLEVEARVVPVTDAMRTRLDSVLAVAADEVQQLERASRTAGRAARPGRSRDRARILAILGVIDGVLIRNGFVHPVDGAVDLLSEALTPFWMTAGERAGVEARSENRRRAAMITERFPGPYFAVDCDTAAIVYLGVAERLGLPLHMVFVPSRNQRRSHAFVRWREPGRRVDWEATEGRERIGFGGDVRGSADPARSVREGPDMELSSREVTGCSHYLLGVWHERRGEGRAALRAFAEALALFPGHLDARRQFAWNMATLPDLAGRDVAGAIASAREVVRRSGDADSHDTLAAAYAAAGRFDLAVGEARAALADAAATEAARAVYRRRLSLYQEGMAYLQPSR